jgi:hypothetical protein
VLDSRPAGLGPTSPDLLEPESRPYFLWWTTTTVAELRRLLASPDPQERLYWLGALLREANSRDVWLFTSPEEIRSQWSGLLRYLGRRREMWGWLLGVSAGPWPPPEPSRGPT